jgi:hypothetical protein
MDFLGSWQGLLLYLFALLSGWIVGWIQTREPLIRKVKALESGLELDSVQKMERILMLEEELRWAKAKVQAQESDLDRMQKKLIRDSGMDLPQQNMSYWRIEGPKLKQRVLDLEMELQKAQDQLMWKLQ